VRAPVRAALLATALAALTGCGENVQSPDLFLLNRTGAGAKLTLLVNDSGTIRCDGAAARPLSDPLLIQARDLADALAPDAEAGLRIASGRRSVDRYTIRLANGTISFPDTAGAAHPELAQAELFALQASGQACKLTG
jgi:hypothetical protein